MVDKNICLEFETHICEYIDGELPQEEMGKFQRHLNECEKCREILQKTVELTSELGEIEEEIPNGLHESIVNKIKYEKFKKRSANITKFVKIFSASTAAMFCIFCVFTFARLSMVQKSSENDAGELTGDYSLEENGADHGAGGFFSCSGKTQLQDTENTQSNNTENSIFDINKNSYILSSDGEIQNIDNSVIGKWSDGYGFVFEFKNDFTIIISTPDNIQYYGTYQILPQYTIAMTFPDTGIVSATYENEDGMLEIIITGGKLPFDK